MGLYLKVAAGVEVGLVWVVGRWGEGEVDVWAPCFELWGLLAGSQQEALNKNKTQENKQY